MELKKIDAQEFATLPNFDVEYEDSAYAGEMSEKAYNVLADACDDAQSGYFEEMLQDLYLDQALLAREMDVKGAFARIVKRLYEHGVASCYVPRRCLHRLCVTSGAGPRTRCADGPNCSAR